MESMKNLQIIIIRIFIFFSDVLKNKELTEKYNKVYIKSYLYCFKCWILSI